MVVMIRHDLEFILQQILISEAHAAGADLTSLIPNPFLPYGLRTVDGSLNNLLAGQSDFGAADTLFPRMTDAAFINENDGDIMFLGPGAPVITNNNYSLPGSVADADPRIISNLIVDQTASNPAAVLASQTGSVDALGNLHIPNVAADEGLSAPFNSWMTLFGQFFDHGLDLLTKGGNGTVYIPLQPDDPLIAGGNGILGDGDDLPAHLRFMALTRATPQMVDPDGDGPLAAVAQHQNTTTSFVDQNQTYTSHSSHQVFLREYALNDGGNAVSTGLMLEGAAGGLASWAEVKAQALEMLGIALNDFDVHNVPLLKTDQYGKFIPGPNGYAQMVMAPDAEHAENWFKGGTAAGITTEGSIGTNHAFLNDIAHHAGPGFVDLDHDGIKETAQTADLNEGDLYADDHNPLTYDDELLDRHFITGDGRGNENLGLTTVHFIFHAEHNRLVEHVKEVVLATGDATFISQWQMPDGSWNGERLFQAARFGTEMQYQHLVFEEFARKVQPMVNVFGSYNATIDASIAGEFAHVVYRFGHSMLTESIDRFDPQFNASHIGLIEGFLNPVEFTNGLGQSEMAGSIIRGMTRQVGNEIDEFVVEALRNNLLGLPLDLATLNLARGRDTGVATLNEARRQFYEGTGDAQLKPYESWVDFALHAKNEMSVVNFIAAYGKHEALQAPDVNTAAEKRGVALALVMGGSFTTDEGHEILIDDIDRYDFLNSQGAYANDAGITTTGVDDIDLWIGGLAEAKMPFGGMLGSTFNFVFETQMEALQDGDRFYYLTRTVGLNFLHQLEGNSFASLIMRNTEVTHLPGDVFSTPNYILEVDVTRQFNEGLGILGNDDPQGASIFSPLVIRNNPATAGLDGNYLRFTGGEHVVLGGTDGNDILISGIGDDTHWGDGGNDRLEGGAGNDILNGGDGDDIITDSFGDDNLKGGDGNDVLSAGAGFDLLLAGDGADFVIGGEDPDETFGGGGGDFIAAGEDANVVFAGEGDDWVEGGAGNDLLQGDNGDPFQNSSVIGNDVIIGQGGDDDFDTESGDDIMVVGVGVDRAEGMLGFDWATYKDETSGIEADMNVRVFAPPVLPGSPNAFLDRFDSTEGLSGSAFSDILRGDNANAALMIGNELNNFDLIAGLKDGLNPLFALGVGQFTGGNIILGGAGSDTIEGRGGNDLIDGDAWLNVRLSIRSLADPDVQIATYNSMSEFQAQMLSGAINPGQIRIVREILTAPDADFDTAMFSGNRLAYTVEGGGVDVNGDGYITVSHNDAVLGLGQGADGVDLLRNIERLQFADTSLIINGVNDAPVGLLAILDNVTGLPVVTPGENQVLRASIAGVTDADNPGGVITGPVVFYWQAEDGAGSGVFVDLERVLAGEIVKVTGTNFTPNDAEVGLQLRVRAVYQDANGVLEEVLSAPTVAVLNVNDAPVGIVAISDATPAEDQVLSALNLFSDEDGLTGTVFNYQWQWFDSSAVGAVSANAPNDPGWTNILGAAAQSFAAPQELTGRQLRAVVSYTDNQGTSETVRSAPTAAVLNVNDLPTGSWSISDTTPTETFTINATLNALADDDGLPPALSFVLQWQELDGAIWADIAGANALAFTPGQEQVNQQLRIVVRYTDAFGANEEFASAPTIVTGDFIAANALAQTLTGTEGQDIITGGGGNDIINAGGENDIINFTIGDETDTVNGGAGNDLMNISGTAGADILRVLYTGGATNRITNVNAGSVTGVEVVSLDLVGGIDTLSYNPLNPPNTTVDVSVNLAAGTATGFASIAGVENATGGSGDDTFIGDINNNIFVGGANNNGALDGDTYSLAGTSAGAVITQTSATSAEAGTDTLSGIENFTGSQGNDVITVNGGQNTVDGQGGDDTLNAGGGNDRVFGGAGNDTIIYNVGGGADAVNGGAGSDTLQILGSAPPNAVTVSYNGTSISNVAGGAISNVESVTIDLLGGSNDTLTYSGGSQAVTVNIATSTASGFTLFAGVENVAGGGGGDTLTGDAQSNTLSGNGGNDTLNGGAGADTLNGGANNDIFVASIGDGNDIITGGAGADTLDLSATSAAAIVTTILATSADIGSDTLSQLENVIGSSGGDTITLNGNANVIQGRGGADIIDAGGANDTITGGLGADILTGGTGNDDFVYTDILESGIGVGQRDIIADFITGLDDIVLTAIDANTVAGGNNTFTFLTLLDAAFTGAGQVRYGQIDTNGDLTLDSTLIQGNVNADLGADFEILLQNYTGAVVANDFAL